MHTSFSLTCVLTALALTAPASAQEAEKPAAPKVTIRKRPAETTSTAKPKSAAKAKAAAKAATN